MPRRRCCAVLLVATARSAAQPIALLRGAGMSMAVSQLSGIAPAKRHIFQCPACQGDWTELGQVTPRAPPATVLLRHGWRRPSVPAVPFSPFFLFSHVKEGRNETICLGRSGMDSRKVLFWVNVKHFTGALSPCVYVCVLLVFVLSGPSWLSTALNVNKPPTKRLSSFHG